MNQAADETCSKRSWLFTQAVQKISQQQDARLADDSARDCNARFFATAQLHASAIPELRRQHDSNAHVRAKATFGDRVPIFWRIGGRC